MDSKNNQTTSNQNDSNICPSENKKNQFSKKILLWIIIVLILLGLCCVGIIILHKNISKEKNISAPKSSTEYTSIRTIELIDALKDDVKVARNSYLNKNLAIIGKVRVIDSKFQYITIYPVNHNFEVLGIQCHIYDKDIKNQIKKMKKGQILTVKGTVTDVSKVAGYSIDVDEIIIE